MKEKQKKYQKGITLIALVITIITLLILAGVTINIVINQGIMEKSQTAVSKYSEEQAKESLNLAILNYKMSQLTGKEETFEKIIAEIGGIVTHNEGEETYTVKLDGYEFTVNDSTFEIEGSKKGETSGKTETPTTPEEPETPEAKKYTITYNANGGTGSMEEGEKIEGTAYTIASNGFTGATGYGFKEWNTQADGKGTTYTENQSYSTEANLTLYAIWYKNVYNIGDTVAIGEEQFYVLADSDSTVTLITKYNLRTSKVDGKWKQAPNASYSDTACAFSSTDYWKNDFESDSLDLNDLGKESVGDAIAKAKEYAKTVIGDSSNNTGRLLTNEEKDDLWDQSYWNGNIAKMLWGQENTQSNGKYLRYWIGTACDSDYVWYVDGSFGGSLSDLYSSKEYNGVRPVITVAKSKIQ